MPLRFSHYAWPATIDGFDTSSLASLHHAIAITPALVTDFFSLLHWLEGGVAALHAFFTSRRRRLFNFLRCSRFIFLVTEEPRYHAASLISLAYATFCCRRHYIFIRHIILHTPPLR